MQRALSHLAGLGKRQRMLLMATPGSSSTSLLAKVANTIVRERVGYSNLENILALTPRYHTYRQLQVVASELY